MQQASDHNSKMESKAVKKLRRVEFNETVSIVHFPSDPEWIDAYQDARIDTTKWDRARFRDRIRQLELLIRYSSNSSAQ